MIECKKLNALDSHPSKSLPPANSRLHRVAHPAPRAHRWALNINGICLPVQARNSTQNPNQPLVPAPQKHTTYCKKTIFKKHLSPKINHSQNTNLTYTQAKSREVKFSVSFWINGMTWIHQKVYFGIIHFALAKKHLQGLAKSIFHHN